MSNNELSSALREIISALHKGLRKQMYSVATWSMTEMQTIGLLARHDSLLPSELAVFTKVSTQSMSQIISKMGEEGLVKRSPSKEDKRKMPVSITARGRALVERTRYDRDEWLKGVIEKSLTERDREQLIKSLPALMKLLNTK